MFKCRLRSGVVFFFLFFLNNIHVYYRLNTERISFQKTGLMFVSLLDIRKHS